MQVKIQNVRLSFPHLFTAASVAGDPESKAKFSASFLFDPKDPDHAKQIKEITAAIKAVAAEKWPKGVPKAMVPCLRNGNEKDWDGYEDMIYLSSSETRRPVAVDGHRHPVTEDDGVIYAGCYVNAIVSLWAQDNNWGKRVNASLRGVQFVRDGEPFGEGASIDPETEFDILGDDDGDGLLAF